MNIRKAGEAYFHRLTQQGPTKGLDKLIWPILQGLSQVYTAAVVGKINRYIGEKGAQVRLPVKVISIGNITVGGTGKTPMACYTAAFLEQMGYRIALLNRGYKAKLEGDVAILSDGTQCLLTPEEGGDEPYLLAKKLPHVPVVIGCKRALTGAVAVQQFAPDVLIMDDAYQHWSVYRDLDMVLIDSTNPFGNGRVIPSGILREPLAHLNRAHLIILTKTDQSKDLEGVYRTIRCYNKKAPIIESVHKIKGLCSYESWNEGKGEWKTLDTKKVMAFSAIGNPASFHHLLETLGYDIEDAICFEDHHSYTKKEVHTILQEARKKGCYVVTTEKDAVKLDTLVEKKEDLLYILAIEIEITKGKDIFEQCVCQLMEG